MEKIFKVVRVDYNGGSVKMDEERKEIEAAGGVIEGYNCTTEDEIIDAAKDADVIITDGASITRKVFEALPRCKAIIRCGVGYDTVDIPAATDNHVLVVNIPDFCQEEVANHVIMLMLAHCKKLIKLNGMVKQGQWAEAKKAQIPMSAIHGETLGIIGCGRIGRTVAAKARCFDMNIIGYDKYLPKEKGEQASIKMVDLKELLQKSDYITLHVALTKETFHLIGKSELSQMRPNSVLINTSRGPTIDEAALIQALQEKRVAGACLDVFEKEPIDANNPLLKMDNVITLPHSASYSDAAFIRLRTSVGKEAARIARGMMPINVVNIGVKPKVNLKPCKD